MKIKKKDIAFVLILVAAVLLIRPGLLAISYASTYTCGGNPSVTYPFAHEIFTQVQSGYFCTNPPFEGCSYTCFRNDTTSTVTSLVSVPPSFTSAVFRYSGLQSATLPSAGVLMDTPSFYGMQIKIGNSTTTIPLSSYLAVTEIDPCSATTEYYSIKTIDMTSILSAYKGTNASINFIMTIKPSTYQTDFSYCYQAQAAFLMNYSIDFVVPPTTCTNTCPTGQTQNAYPDCACHAAPIAPPGFSNILSQLTTLINQVLAWFKALFGL